MNRADLEAIRARADAATPGPWYLGRRMGLAGVNATYFGEGRCSYCRPPHQRIPIIVGQPGTPGLGTPPAWTGRAEINGKVMEAHIHILEPEESEPWEQSVYAWPDEPAPAETEVVGMTDIDRGGVAREEDRVFIAHARTDIPALLDYIAQLEREIRLRARQS